jgi:acyl-CoA hydrolase
MSEVNFVASAKLGDIIEIGCELVNFGKTSITIACEVRNKDTKQSIIRIDKIVFVLVDSNGKPTPHGFLYEY